MVTQAPLADASVELPVLVLLWMERSVHMSRMVNPCSVYNTGLHFFGDSGAIVLADDKKPAVMCMVS